MHSQALILPIAASIMLPLTSEAAFVSSTGRAPMHRRGQLSSPSPKTIHVNPTVTSSTSKSTALHSSFDDFGLLPSPEMGSSFLYSSIAMSTSLIGTNTDFQDSTSQLHALNENINNALYDLEIQSTIMHTLAHAVDFSTLIVPEVPLLRTASLLARILSIFADYIPDHTIASNEVVFQAPMLIVSSVLFAQSVLPMLTAVVSSLTAPMGMTTKESSSSSTWKNRYAYHHLFRQVGVSSLQFRYLTSVGAIDWVDVKAHDTLLDGQDDPEHLYWAYRGSTELCLAGDESSITFVGYNKNIASRTSRASEFVGFLPDMKFLCQQDKKRLKRKKGKLVARRDVEVPSSCQYPQATIKAGPSGARVMRVHKKKLLQLMENDVKLSDSIQALLVNGMERELEVLLTTAHSDVESVNMEGYEVMLSCECSA